MATGAILALALAGQWDVPTPSGDPLGDLNRAAALAAMRDGGPAALDEGCERSGDGDAIVVCGRGARFERMVMPPVPGARRSLIAGEPPSAAAALGGTCMGLCGRGVGISVDPVALLRDPIAELKRALHIER